MKHGILALLRDRPGYGYRLRSAFEESTGPTWPVNVGQIYNTFGRLEHDGLVAKTGEDAEGYVVYEITASGTTVPEDWFTRSITVGDRPRDELAMKLALAVTRAHR